MENGKNTNPLSIQCFVHEWSSLALFHGKSFCLHFIALQNRTFNGHLGKRIFPV